MDSIIDGQCLEELPIYKIENSSALLSVDTVAEYMHGTVVNYGLLLLQNSL